MFRIYLFGQPRFEVAANNFVLRARPRVLSLLVYLLIHRSEPVARARIAYALWTDESEKNAHANLRRHLNHLRNALPRVENQTWFFSDTVSVQWNTRAPYWLDLAEFEAKCRDASQMPHAVQLYTGDLHANLYDDWIFYERERLRNLYFNSLNVLIETNTARGNFAQAESYTEQLLAHDPLREDAIRRLMQLKYARRDRAGAILVYDRFVKQLHQELDIEPLEETTTLYQTIVHHHNTILPGSDPEKTGSTKTRNSQTQSAMPFVGRELEMEQLRAAFHRAARGNGGIVLIGGEAGIGKTRLVSEVLAFAERENARALRGSTTFPETMPYQALIEMLRANFSRAGIQALDAETFGLIETLLPELQTTPPHSHPLPFFAPEQERARLYAAIAAWLDSLARKNPLVLLWEDLHWASGATIDLLESLARHAAQAPILHLATYREEQAVRSHPLRGLRRKLQQEHRLVHLALGGLNQSAVEEYVTHSPHGTLQLARELYRTSEGNPLFLRELIQTQREQISAKDAPTLPATIQDTILARANRLAKNARSLIEIAATLGNTFSLELLQHVSGWRESDLHAALIELLDHQLIRETGGASGLDFAFTHHLIQMTLYEQATPELRAQRHHRIGTIMQDLYGARQTELAGEFARHFDLGGDATRAAQWYIQAGVRAAQLYANQEAMQYYRQASACAQRAGDNDTAARALLALGQVAFHSGQDAQAENVFQQALALSPDTSIRSEVELELSGLWGDHGDERAGPLIEHILATLDPRTEPDKVHRAKCILAVLYGGRGQLTAAIQLLEKVNAAHTPNTNWRVVESNLFFLSAFSCDMANFARARAWATRLSDFGSTQKNDWVILMALQLDVRCDLWIGHWKHAEANAQAAIALAEKIGTAELVAHNQIFAAQARAGQGNLSDAYEIAHAAWRLAQESHAPRPEVGASILLARLAADLAQRNKATMFAEHALTMATEAKSYRTLASSHTVRGYVQLRAGNTASALKEFHTAQQIAATTDNRLLELELGAAYAEALLQSGQSAQAKKQIEKYLVLAQAVEAKHFIGVGYRVLGQILTAQKKYAAGTNALRQAIQILNGLGSRLELARAYHIRAQVFRHRARLQSAERDAKIAEQLYAEAGAFHDAAQLKTNS